MSWTVAERSAAADAVLTRAPVLPVLAIEHLEDAVPLARALVDGGLPVLEVTLRTAAALPAIAAMIAGGDTRIAELLVIADSPVDIGRFCDALTTSPTGGWASAEYRLMTFEVHNVDCYPTTLEGAVQHNAWWDAMALRRLLTESLAKHDKKRGRG